METKTKVILLRAPLLILMIVSFLTSVILALGEDIEGVGWTSTIVLGIALALYFLGGYTQRKEE